MAGIKIDQGVSNVEKQREIQEIVKAQDASSIQNPALKRCAEMPIPTFNPEKDARQAYDRMHHRHNRS